MLEKTNTTRTKREIKLSYWCWTELTLDVKTETSVFRCVRWQTVRCHATYLRLQSYQLIELIREFRTIECGSRPQNGCLRRKVERHLSCSFHTELTVKQKRQDKISKTSTPQKVIRNSCFLTLITWNCDKLTSELLLRCQAATCLKQKQKNRNFTSPKSHLFAIH